MTMQRKPSDTENKLLLLHAIDRLGPVTAEQLLVFMVENEQMGYVSLQLGLAELTDGALIRKKNHPLGALYALTGKGHDALAMFRERIPYSRLSLVDEKASAWRQRFRREKQMLADFRKMDNGEYRVELCLLENEENLLDIAISVPTHAHAQRFCDTWIAKATSVYAHIMHTLGENESESET